MNLRRFRPAGFMVNAGVFIMVGCIFTYELIRALLADKIYVFAVILGTVMITIGGFLNNHKLNYGRKKMLPWMLIGCLSLWKNAELARGVYNTELLFLCYLWSAVILAGVPDWQKKIKKNTVIFGFLHVAATLVFFVFRGSYSIMVNLWGRYPTGTNQGATGYRAGITTHYSQNATYIAILFIVLGCSYIIKQKRMRKKGELVALILTLFALMLTAKRAHLCFGLAAVIFVYYLVNSEKRGNKVFKLTVAVLGITMIVAMVYEVAPGLFETFLGRFAGGGYGDITSGRIPMWLLAIELFKSSPILGIGWSGYRYAYAVNLYSGYEGRAEFVNTHNVYLQLLCEVGIIGFLMFIFVLYTFVHNGLALNKYYTHDDTEKKINIGISLGMGIFFILYSFTGCCLYDLTFHMFILMVAMIMPYRKNEVRK